MKGKSGETNTKDTSCDWRRRWTPDIGDTASKNERVFARSSSLYGPLQTAFLGTEPDIDDIIST